MGERLRYAPFEEAMNVAYSIDPLPIVPHSVWIGDFPGVARHDVSCPVCMSAPAMMMQDHRVVGFVNQFGDARFYPCPSCQERGWMMARIPRWLRYLVERFSSTWDDLAPQGETPTPKVTP